MPITLKDPSLLRQQCYVDGAWIDADGGGKLDVTNRRAAVKRAEELNLI